MGTIEKTVEFAASPEKVWAVVSDLPRWGEWLTIHKSWKDEPPTEIATGSTLKSVVSVLNMPNTITWNVDNYEAPTTMSISGAGMAGAKVSITITVAPAGEGTALSLSCTFEGQMVVGAIGAAIERAGMADLDSSLVSFEALVS